MVRGYCVGRDFRRRGAGFAVLRLEFPVVWFHVPLAVDRVDAKDTIATPAAGRIFDLPASRLQIPYPRPTLSGVDCIIDALSIRFD